MKNINETIPSLPEPLTLAGLVHDLNGAATCVMLAMEIVRRHIPGESTRTLAIGNAAMERLRNLLTELNALSNKNALRGALTCIPQQLIAQTLDAFRLLLPPEVKLIHNLWPNLQKVAMNPTDVDRILFNLLRNALEAMLPKGGNITVLAHNVTVQDSLATNLGNEVKPGKYVLVSVKDEGCGIPLAIQIRLFKPFVTSKVCEKGTGLGLATAKTILVESGGAILFKSTATKGTKFCVFLPVVNLSDGE